MVLDQSIVAKKINSTALSYEFSFIIDSRTVFVKTRWVTQKGAGWRFDVELKVGKCIYSFEFLGGREEVELALQELQSKLSKIGFVFSTESKDVTQLKAYLYELQMVSFPQMTPKQAFLTQAA
ncbi:hypothetical protein NTH44_003175 [Vibrio metoecus]